MFLDGFDAIDVCVEFVWYARGMDSFGRSDASIQWIRNIDMIVTDVRLRVRDKLTKNDALIRFDTFEVECNTLTVIIFFHFTQMRSSSDDRIVDCSNMYDFNETAGY